MEQFTKLIAFRQAVYEHGLVRARDAQFELVDALLLSPMIRSFPELSLCPAFRRQWMSAYEAIRKGRQDREWLERYFMRLVPTIGCQVFSLDGTAWPHPQAKVTEDLQYVHSPTSAIDGGNIVIGHPHSVLAWVPEIGRSWAPPMSVRRIPSQQTAVEMGTVQVKQLCDERREEMMHSFHLIAADGAYGNHRFLGPLKNEPCGIIARLRRDRVLYGIPGPYSGRGRPRVHGARFAFKEPETWWKADATVDLEDKRWGKVRLRRWDDLHALQDAKTPFSVILVECHLGREKPQKPLWLAYQPPAHQTPEEQSVVDLWRGYQHRWPVEPSIRFRKQYLYWTLPRFQRSQHCDRWTMLVSIAQWQLFLAREFVIDNPLPWQPAQEELTPERVQQGLGGLFQQISTPASPPKARGKSPGWPKGKPRTLRKRQKVVKKTKHKAKAA
jgi:hypothetical protein